MFNIFDNLESLCFSNQFSSPGLADLFTCHAANVWRNVSSNFVNFVQTIKSPCETENLYKNWKKNTNVKKM